MRLKTTRGGIRALVAWLNGNHKDVHEVWPSLPHLNADALAAHDLLEENKKLKERVRTLEKFIDEQPSLTLRDVKKSGSQK